MKARIACVSMLVLALEACQTSSEPTRVLVDEDELSESQFDESTNLLCPVIVGKRLSQCYTSPEADSRDPIGVLHQRFMRARQSYIATGGSDVDEAALCSEGFMASCELVEVLGEYGYRPDGELIFQLRELMSGNISSHLASLFEKETLYPENYDPTSREQFESVLRKAIRILKANDKYWRKDW
jgi:hypothetical protein